MDGRLRKSTPFPAMTGHLAPRGSFFPDRPGRCLGSRSSGVSDRADASEAVQAA